METLGSEQVYANPWLTVREDRVRRPDGSTGVYAVIDTPDIAVVVPAEGDRVHLVEQYRYPVSGRRWELPSGSAEVGRDRDPAAVAARELREETGLVAGTLTPLGTLEVTPSMVNHRCWVFLATDLAVGSPEPDLEEQGMRSAWFTRSEVRRMVLDGTVTDAKSIAAFALLMLGDANASESDVPPV